MGTERGAALRILVVGAGVGGLSVARGLLRDGHDVTVVEQRPEVQAAGGAVTIWSHGATVLGQLGVELDGAGQRLSTVRVLTCTGRELATLDVAAVGQRLGAPVRMVPRRVLLDRLLAGFPADRIRCNSRVVGVLSTATGVQAEFEDGSCADADVVIGADGLRSTVRDIVGAQSAQPTGWCSWQGLVTLAGVSDPHVATVVIGGHGNVGLWPAGGSDLQWWFDLPWSFDFIRPDHPIEVLRSDFSGWSDSIDLLLATLTDDDLAASPYPHFRHPMPRPAGHGALTLLGDAAHTMPPTLAQGTNQALLDTMVLRKALSDFRTGSTGGHRGNGDPAVALRRYEATRRRRVAAVSRVASLQVSHGESVLRPAAMISDRFMTWALTTFLRCSSHRRMSAQISRDLGAAVGDGPVGTDRAPVGTPSDPVRVRGQLDAPSRWLWLVKWCVLAVPHYPILMLLYLVYPLLTVAAGAAIVVTGRYPRAVFDFNVGVLRWSWRVMNYRFPMNSTDKFPPFTLASRPDYPGDLQVDYPERLSRWAVPVKSWLLALPQILICWAMEPLLQVLCVIAAGSLLVTGTLPQGMFELLLGIVRWRYRVAVYVSLMRDEYPPFRLDLGSR